jgi:dTDP-4-amino-4,6-dideoxygalactose transaminase
MHHLLHHLWPEADEVTAFRLTRILDSPRWAIAQGGPEKSQIDKVEKVLTQTFDTGHAFTTCNGSAAIVIALQALQLVPGSKVIVPATTWVGCASAVLRAGLEPVFVDAGVDNPLWDYQVPPEQEIGAILAVHLYASRIDVAEIRRRYPNTPIIEDCSHSQSKVSKDANIGIYSFQATKALTCGEGGAALTSDNWLAVRLEPLRADGRVRWEPNPNGLRSGEIQGANYAMSEITAALLADQLVRFAEQCQRRSRNVKRFVEAIGQDRVIADTSALTEGSFYGLPVYGDTRSIEELIAEESNDTSHCHDMYPPIPTSNLWHTPVPGVLLENSERWTMENIVIIPHEAFLSTAVTNKLIQVIAEEE